MALRERLRALAATGLATIGLTLLRAAGAVQPKPPDEGPEPDEGDPEVSPALYPPVALSQKAQAMLAEGIAPKPKPAPPPERVLRGSLRDRMRGDR